MIKSNKRGFTLIELLVVIAIIGVLVTIGTFGVRGALQRARNSERKSDLSQYRNSLEGYANANNGIFPVHTSPYCMSSICGPTNLCVNDLVLTGCPEDPSLDAGSDPADIATRAYRYESNASGTEYVLNALLEGGTNNYWVVCSNGKVTENSGMGDIASTCL